MKSEKRFVESVDEVFRDGLSIDDHLLHDDVQISTRFCDVFVGSNEADAFYGF